MLGGLVEAIAMAPVCLVDGVFLAEVLLGLRRHRAASPAAAPPRIALVVPAHNEQAIIRGCLETMRANVPAGTRILVVAHNCHDATAAEARAAGVEVAPLDRPEERGKGYALSFGRDRLAADPPEVAIVLDADCVPEAGAIARLAAAARAHDAPVQAAYLFRSRPSDGPMVQISNFAVLVKNLVRQRGARRIGAPAVLVGSGMAFPWRLFATLPLATGNLVEDLALGVDLVRAGRLPRFEEGARIWSTPGTDEGTRTQRVRWETGFLGTARALAWPLVGEGLRRGRWSAIWTGLHLATPPLTLLLVANVALVALLGLLTLVGGSVAAFAVAGGLLASILAAVLAAWAKEGRRVLSGRVLLRLPFYFLWKLALYARLARRVDKPSWTRTERAG